MSINKFITDDEHRD